MQARAVRLRTFFLFASTLALARAEPLELLLAPAIDAELSRLAALPHPTGDDAPTAYSFVQNTRMAAEEGRRDDPRIIDESSSLIATEGGNADVRITRAEAWLRLAQPRRALAELNAIASLDTALDFTIQHASRLRAVALQRLGRIAPALELAEKNLAANPDADEPELKELVSAVKENRAEWERLVVPLLGNPSAKPTGDAARCAHAIGARDVATDLAWRALAANPKDDDARDVIAWSFVATDLNNPAIIRAAATLALPRVAAWARAYPQNPEAWDAALACSRALLADPSLSDDAQSKALASFSALLRDSSQSGFDYPADQLRVRLYGTRDLAALRALAPRVKELSETGASLPDEYARLELRRGPVGPAFSAAIAKPATRDLWARLFADARTAFENKKLSVESLRFLVRLSGDAGHDFPSESVRVDLYTTEPGGDLVRLIRSALQLSREDPSLNSAIEFAASRFPATDPRALGQHERLIATVPVPDELAWVDPKKIADTKSIADPVARARAWVALGAPFSALASLDSAPPELRAQPSAWLLRAQLLREIGQYPQAMIAVERAWFAAGKPGDDFNPETEVDGLKLAPLLTAIENNAGRIDERISDLEEKLARDPSDAADWAALAKAWIDHPESLCPSRAALAAAQALSIDPANADARLARFDGMRLLAERLPAELRGTAVDQLRPLLDALPADDWVSRVRYLRIMPAGRRAPLASEWLATFDAKSSKTDAAPLRAALLYHTLNPDAPLKKIAESFADIGPWHPLRPERDSAEAAAAGQAEAAALRAREQNEALQSDPRWPFVSSAIDELDYHMLRCQMLSASSEQGRVSAWHLMASAWLLYRELHESKKGESIMFTNEALAEAGTFSRFCKMLDYDNKTAPAGPPPIDAKLALSPADLDPLEKRLVLVVFDRLLFAANYIDHARIGNAALALRRPFIPLDAPLDPRQEAVSRSEAGGDLFDSPELVVVRGNMAANDYERLIPDIRALSDRKVANPWVAYFAARFSVQAGNFAQASVHLDELRAMVPFSLPMLKLARSLESRMRAVSTQKAERRAQIDRRLAYLDQRDAYVTREARRCEERMKDLARQMDSLRANAPSPTLYNYDRIQYQADSIALQAQNTKESYDKFVGELPENESERAELKAERARL